MTHQIKYKTSNSITEESQDLNTDNAFIDTDSKDEYQPNEK